MKVFVTLFEKTARSKATSWKYEGAAFFLAVYSDLVNGAKRIFSFVPLTDISLNLIILHHSIE